MDEKLQKWKNDLEKRLKRVTSKEEQTEILMDAFRRPSDTLLAETIFRVEPGAIPKNSEQRLKEDEFRKRKVDVVIFIAKKFDLDLRSSLYRNDNLFSWGSSPKFLPLTDYHCANNDPCRQIACAKEGKLRGSGCFLVAYCSKECQRENWSHHRKFCKSYLASDDWQPKWLRENRSPNFVKDNSVGTCQLWGRTPAIDVMKRK